VLTDTKSRYPQTQKLLYAVVMATKKLQHYFTEHEVSVVTLFPLGEVVRNCNAVGWISKWERCDDRHLVLGEVVLQLLGCHDDGI